MSKLRVLLKSIILLSSFICSNAQTTDWAVSFGSTGNEDYVFSKIDNDGNVYTTGMYWEDINHNPSSLSLAHIGSGDVFIEKRDGNGNLLWAKGIGNTMEDRVYAISITSDGVIISGVFEGVLDANPDTNVFNLVSNGGVDTYMIKLDVNGDFVWAKNFGNTETVFPYDMETDISNNTILSVQFNNVLELNSSISLMSPLPSLPLSGGLIKIDNMGNVLWGYATGTAFAKDIAFDNNDNIFLTGIFLQEVDFDYSSNTHVMSETGYVINNFPINFDTYIQKLSPNGDFIWAKQLKDPVHIIGHSITIDNSGNVYTSGVWQGSSVNIDFDPGPNVFSVASIGSLNSKQFIHKLNASGDFEWVNTFGNWSLAHDYINPQKGGFLSLDNNENLYFSGDVKGLNSESFDFNGETYDPQGQDIFIAKINKENGFGEWSTMLGGSGSDNVYDANFDPNDNLIISGAFQNTVDFNIQETSSLELSSNGESDAFIMKIKSEELSLNSLDNKPQFSISPNPTTGEITIKNLKNDVNLIAIKLYDALGQIVVLKKSGNLSNIDINHLSSGLYNLRIETEKKEIYTMKIIKK